MNNTDNNNLSLLEMFGLSQDQVNLMLSTEHYITECDIKSTNKKEPKQKWLQKWESKCKEQGAEFIPESELHNAFLNELSKSPNRTWYYIIVLECLAFSAYTVLDPDKPKEFKGWDYRFKNQTDTIKEFFLKHNILNEDKIDSLYKTFKKSYSHLSGKIEKIAIGILSVIAIASLAAVLCSLKADKIAKKFWGKLFPALHGQALSNACLAYVGGGAIKFGGHGVQGGRMIIAGGGALLGLSIGGTATGISSVLLLSSPQFALTQAAKLETILKEIILNEQKDVITAQKIIQGLQSQVDELNSKITELELNNKDNEKEIKNIKKSVDYLIKSGKEMQRFTSSFDIGLHTTE